MDELESDRCPTCGGELSGSKTYCLACGRLIPRFADPPEPAPRPRGTGLLGERLRKVGTGLLGGHPLVGR